MPSELLDRLRSLVLVVLAISALAAHAQTIRLEAEDAKLGGPSLKIMPADSEVPVSHTDYSGRGYVTGFDQPSDRLTFHISLKQAGVYALALSYRSPAGRRDYDISVNGVGTSGTFAPTPNRNFWTTPAGKVELIAKPLVLNEFGGTPDIPHMQALGEYWVYALAWSNQYALLGPQKNTPEELKRIYTSPRVVTLSLATAP